MLAFLGTSPATAGAAGAQEGDGGDQNGANVRVDRAVLDALAEDDGTGTSDFWVILRDRADLGRAESMNDWNERGQYVYDQLTSTATDSQRDLVADLTARDADFESFWIVNAVYVRNGTQSTLQMIRNNHPEVARVRAPQTYEVPEPIDATERAHTTAVEWGVANIRADQVWDQLGVRGEGVVVASLDTGVEFTHPALVNQYRGNLGGGTFDHNYNWFDPGGDNCATEPCDTDIHGTHTMGTMVGDDGAGNQVGVAPGAQWISALGCPFGGCPDFDLLSSGEWIMAPTDLSGQNPRPDLRANVVNNSWGAGNGPFEDPFFAGVVDAWTAAGIFGVFSNGNDGPSCDTAGSPADDIDAWGVGAYDIGNNIAFFSSRGPGGEPPDQYIKPNISAPGVDVRSSIPGSDYGFLSGTSMAAPHVTGTVALMWSASAATFGDIAGTRDLLNETAIDVDDTSCGGDADNNNVFGEGRLDAFAATDATPRGPTGTLVGTVTDATTGDPISGATVTATVEGRPRSTRTGPDGTYSLRLPVGTFDVTASAVGYRDVTQSAEIVEGQETTLDFALPAAPRLLGTVTDANTGDPIAGAIVTATQGDETVTAVTAADGTYELILDLGTWTVTFEADDYATETEEVTFTEDGQRVTLDVALRTGLASVDPDAIEEILLPDQQRTTELTLSNTGTAPFDWEAFERGGGTVDGEISWLREPSTVAASSVRRNATAPANRVAGPSAARWRPDVAAPQQANILVYADDFRHAAPNTYVDQALQRLGLAYTAFYDGNFSGFETALAQGGWDVVIFANENFFPSASSFDALNAYATGGGKLVATSWAMDSFPTHPLWATLGATFVSTDTDPPDPVHWWEPDHPLFTDPEQVPELTQLEGGFYFSYGQHVGVLPGFEGLAGYTEAPAPDEATLVLGNGERTLFKGFSDAQNDADLDSDGILDGVELWVDTVSGIEGGFFVDVPWLDVDPDSGTVDAGDSQAVDVTIDTTGLEPGVYSAQVVFRISGAASTPRLTVPIRLVVTPFRQGINVGGEAYTDTSGDRWTGDRAFDGSWGYEYESRTLSVRRPIANTENDRLYQDARTGRNFNYRFEGLPDGTYEVELLFAEIQRRLPGERLFDVTGDTTPLLIGYDIAEDVGQDTAVSQRFTVEVNDGVLRIRFLRRAGAGQPIVNAVRLTNRPDL